ncbi:glycoside hydrolase family 99-like domain-containing protein [Niabella pedocola]|uniref:Glycoside hydrolase family 99-like domain-containing protein n=1 Tax=Niabella pedocola TaxID=1752077 RepID=A0ABS8PVX2_9BACT|nr:glycoside hydrolase family 99-like domain-containing protein [Niabella pedocola]MCD2425065.1 glycoside hydrolase family 99-like domain-containing protein [Niabella pedocola]
MIAKKMIRSVLFCCLAVVAGSGSALAQRYDVAAFYWPAYHYEPRIGFLFPDKKGEWEIIYKAKPKEEGHAQPKVPLWGYENEADPQVMDRKIKTAVAHGVNTFIFDWYWYEGQPFLESCINNGFLKANKGRMKFYLMWANHDATSYWDVRNPRKDSVIWKGGVNRAEFDKITDRVIRRYFKNPSYYKINGEPVFCIYELQTLINGLGGPVSTKAALDDFRKKTKAAGFPGLHLQGILWSALPASINGVPGDKIQTQDNVLTYFGFSSITNYCWAHLQRPSGDYEKWADASTAMWPGFDRDFSIPYFPNVTIGWDPNPRYPFKAGYITNPAPEKFAKYLEKAKDYLDAHPRQPQLVTINAWNEWSEGSYLEPDTTHKLGYLQVLKRVFPAHPAPGVKQ